MFSFPSAFKTKKSRLWHSSTPCEEPTKPAPKLCVLFFEKMLPDLRETLRKPPALLPESGEMDRTSRNRGFVPCLTVFDIYGLTLKISAVRTAKKTDKSVFFVVISFLVHHYDGPDGDRTHDLRIANATLSQLSYRPEFTFLL